MFAMATSIRRAQAVYACLNPLGDPGDPSQPINPNFFVPPASDGEVHAVGNNALADDLTTAFGPDNQPYFGGQRMVNSFGSPPGSTCQYGVAAVHLEEQRLDVAGRCLRAQSLERLRQCRAELRLRVGPGHPAQRTIVRHGQYLYTGPLGGTIMQFKVTVDPVSGQTTYLSRTIFPAPARPPVLGVADDLKSLMVFDRSVRGRPGRRRGRDQAPAV